MLNFSRFQYKIFRYKYNNIIKMDCVAYYLLKPRIFTSVLKCLRFSTSATFVNKDFASKNCSEVAEEYSHTPVMVNEVLKALNPKDDEVYLDMTFGAGGHSQKLLNAARIKLYCLDRDPVAYNKAVSLSQNFKSKVIPMLGKFSELRTLLEERDVKENSFDGILFDVGCSSMQLDDPLRGFAISKNGPLDMRMDGNRYDNQPTAEDVLNALDVPSLAKIFKIYGEEKHAKKIAQSLFDAKYLLKSIRTTHELSELIHATIGEEQRHDKLHRPVHVATKVFQALRIFVNNELNELNYGIELAYSYLKPGGRLVALSFHSLEDRIIKRQILGIDMDEPFNQTLSQKYKNCLKWHAEDDMEKVYTKNWKPLYKSVITPTDEEIHTNRRSRSAKLRAALKNEPEIPAKPFIPRIKNKE